MDEYIERYGAMKLWAASVLILASVIALLAFLFPQRVYVDFLWQYYWGPVVADANGWAGVAWADGEQINSGTAGPDDGPTATPGYTFVSYAGYIPTLIFMLIGIVLFVERLEIERYRGLFYGLFPFMLFGGALRTLEDANVTTGDAGEMIINLPWSALIISPFIYGVVAAVAVVSLAIAVWLERREIVTKFEYPLFAMGTAYLIVTIALLAYLAADGGIGFFPMISVVTIVGATVITGVTYWAIDRFAPKMNEGTKFMGAVVIWAHSVDGVANLIGLTYAESVFGWPNDLTPKHPINAAIVDFFGNAWPFVALKVAAALFIIYLFNDEFFEEEPRIAILLMITVVAVGLGPGTRDMLRATFGV